MGEHRAVTEIRIRFEGSELDNLARDLEQAGQPEALRWGLLAATKHVEGAERAATPHGPSGNAQAGWESSVSWSPTHKVGLVTNVKPYVAVLDAPQEHGPWRANPPWRQENAALGLWVRRVLGLHGRDARSAAYLIARKIRRSGYTRRHEGFVDRAVRKALPQAVGLIMRALDQLLRRITDGR